MLCERSREGNPGIQFQTYPITCLSLMCKLLTEMLAEDIHIPWSRSYCHGNRKDEKVKERRANLRLIQW